MRFLKGRNVEKSEFFNKPLKRYIGDLAVYVLAVFATYFLVIILSIYLVPAVFDFMTNVGLSKGADVTFEQMLQRLFFPTLSVVLLLTTGMFYLIRGTWRKALRFTRRPLKTKVTIIEKED